MYEPTEARTTAQSEGEGVKSARMIGESDKAIDLKCLRALVLCFAFNNGEKSI